jgi:hypothetical protein
MSSTRATTDIAKPGSLDLVQFPLGHLNLSPLQRTSTHSLLLAFARFRMLGADDAQTFAIRVIALVVSVTEEIVRVVHGLQGNQSSQGRGTLNALPKED